MPLLDIRNLTVEFATATEPFRAVDGVDFAVDEGEVLAIVGESGSGKSVAMLAVMDLLPRTATITADRMTFAGHDLAHLDPRARRRIIGREMSMIFQEPVASLNPCFTVGFQIGEMLETHLGLDRAERRRRSIELLEEVGIPEPERRLSAFPHQLSGGMCQRVMIALALACSPRLLIADEPTTGLDVTTQAVIIDLMRNLADEHGMATIFISHDLGLAAETCQRIVVMHAGQVVETSPTGALFASPRHPYTRQLIRSTPGPDSDIETLATVPGGLPDLTRGDLPACRYAERCPVREPRCATERPPERRAAEGHLSHCWSEA